MSNWREPITDRTIADVRNYDAGSLEYQKGALNADDLNRIEDNYKYLMAKLRSDAIFIPHRLRDFTETVLEYVQTGEVGPEYTLVEYIQSSGTQYIDTGFVPNNNTRVVLDFQELAHTSNWRCIFGSRDTASSTNIYSLWVNNTNKLGAYYNDGVGVYFPSSVVTTNRLCVDFNKGVVTVGEQTVNCGTKTFSIIYTMYLFGSHTGGTLEQGSTIKVYSCQIYDNDVLIRNYVPIIDANGEACLYDKLNHVYYRNKGTGTFVAGPEVPVETDPVYELIETQTTYTDWQENNLPWLSEINRIRANYNALVRLFLVGLGFSEQKESNYLDYIEVNNWERFVLAGKTMFENMEKEYRYCGVEISGGDRLL